MNSAPRVALFADTFHEVNGAARTCREWEAFARKRELPFFCVRWGAKSSAHAEGSIRVLEMVRSSWAFPIDPDLYFDPWFSRRLACVQSAVEEFQPDLVHITSPGDLGIMGAIVAARLRKPLALSWHTNLHEFAARRVTQTLSWLPSIIRRGAARAIEHFVLGRIVWFFGRGDVLFAPNPELVGLLKNRTRKPSFSMTRGVDTALFCPTRRTRNGTHAGNGSRGDCDLVVGYVGRLMPEKNVRLLPQVADALRAARVKEVRFQITGHGPERSWLSRHLPNAEFTGVLTGEALAHAYANMDILAFPSRTDTFGNVVQEALASGVPAVVTDAGGPRFIVRHGISGLVAQSDDDFCEAVAALARDSNLRRRMAVAARRDMAQRSWDRVFEEVYEGYACAFGRA